MRINIHPFNNFLVLLENFPFKIKFLGVFHVSPTEMVVSMKNVAGMDVELTVEERNLLSVAYKNVIGARRASWRIISSIEQREENKSGEEKLKMIREYRQTVKHSRNVQHLTFHTQAEHLYLDSIF